MLSRTLRFAVRIKMSSHRRMCNDEDIISVIKSDTLANKRSAFPLWGEWGREEEVLWAHTQARKALSLHFCSLPRALYVGDLKLSIQ